ncbi:MAG: type II toxin-antitoxin system MqsA family antitoxin [Magnetococcales bacterium]|nr:type II toxin-antitoxin system MqsA family antitoxin [Magnetococcales bacterium]
MKCVICRHDETVLGQVAVTLERDTTLVVIRDVPAEVCQQCGAYFLDGDHTGQVLDLFEGAVARRADVEILRYAA